MGVYRLDLMIDFDQQPTGEVIGRLVGLDLAIAIAADGHEAQLTSVVENTTIVDALAIAADRTRAVVDALDGAGEVIDVEVRPEGGAGPPPDASEATELVGTAEIAGLLGISQQRVRALEEVRGFPAPVDDLGSGPVWRISDLSAFARTWESGPQPPAVAGRGAPPPIDMDKLIGILNTLNTSPVARNAVKLVRWYVKKPRA